MASIYPDKTINYNVYSEEGELLGVATAELPELAYMTETLTGAGLAGEIETPVTGHFGAMSTTLNFNAIQADAIVLLSTKGNTLTLRSAQQALDTAEVSTHKTQGIKIMLKTLPKTMSLGSFEPGAKTDTSIELETPYIKIEVDGKQVLEIDKLNFKCVIGENDLLETVRANLGF